jgi:hypothetical protein
MKDTLLTVTTITIMVVAMGVLMYINALRWAGQL